jgi:microcystin-dependent protein
MADPFVAEIRMFPFNFAPTGWAQCNGQLLPISQNTALFSLLGTYYGGDGKSTFALPDLRDSTPLHPGQGQGLSQYFLAQTGGTANVTLLESEIPFHAHQVLHDGAAAYDTPGGLVTLGSSGVAQIYTTNTTSTTIGPALAPAGGSQPHNNRQPYLTLNFCISLVGVYPQRP